MASKCNVNDWDEIQCISAYMETGDQLVVKGVYQDSFGFPVEGSICLDVRKRTVHMEADQGDRALSADYQLGHPMHIRTTPKLSKIELNGKQTLIIPDDDSYNRFVKLLRYIAMAGKAGDNPENGVSDTGGSGVDGQTVTDAEGETNRKPDGQSGTGPESGTDQGRRRRIGSQTDSPEQVRKAGQTREGMSRRAGKTRFARWPGSRTAYPTHSFRNWLALSRSRRMWFSSPI